MCLFVFSFSCSAAAFPNVETVEDVPITFYKVIEYEFQSVSWFSSGFSVIATYYGESDMFAYWQRKENSNYDTICVVKPKVIHYKVKENNNQSWWTFGRDFSNNIDPNFYQSDVSNNTGLPLQFYSLKKYNCNIFNNSSMSSFWYQPDFVRTGSSDSPILTCPSDFSSKDFQFWYDRQCQQEANFRNVRLIDIQKSWHFSYWWKDGNDIHLRLYFPLNYDYFSTGFKVGFDPSGNFIFNFKQKNKTDENYSYDFLNANSYVIEYSADYVSNTLYSATLALNYDFKNDTFINANVSIFNMGKITFSNFHFYYGFPVGSCYLLKSFIDTSISSNSFVFNPNPLPTEETQFPNSTNQDWIDMNVAGTSVTDLLNNSSAVAFIFSAILVMFPLEFITITLSLITGLLIIGGLKIVLRG